MSAPSYAGLTTTECAKGCGPDGCVISGKSYCAHPRKGGLQGESLNDPEAVERLNKARKMLATRDAAKRYD